MKMSLEVMERIIKTATAKEIDFLVYVMRFQDSRGIIRGITKDEVCYYVGVHKSKFYSILESLESKGIIRIFWHEKRNGFWSILIIDNSFVEKEDYKKGYINLNVKFLWTHDFLKLTKSEKVICLKILSVYREQRKTMTLSFKTFMNWTGMSLQSVKKYISSIRSIFKNLKITGEAITIELDDCRDVFGRSDLTESEIYNEHFVKYILDVKKIKPASREEIKDTLKIFQFFTAKFGTSVIISAIIKCLDNQGKLIPKYINKMTNILSKNRQLVEIFY